MHADCHDINRRAGVVAWHSAGKWWGSKVSTSNTTVDEITALFIAFEGLCKAGFVSSLGTLASRADRTDSSPRLFEYNDS